MPGTKIAFELELLIDEAPGEVLVAALRAVATQLAKSPDPMHAHGEATAEDGSLRWRVREWAAGELVRCVGCGREVARAECDVTADGERCRACSLAGTLSDHVEAALVNANERGYVDGVLGLPRRGRLVRLVDLLTS
jgi:hypothetical protein